MLILWRRPDSGAFEVFWPARISSHQPGLMKRWAQRTSAESTITSSTPRRLSYLRKFASGTSLSCKLVSTSIACRCVLRPGTVRFKYCEER